MSKLAHPSARSGNLICVILTLLVSAALSTPENFFSSSSASSLPVLQQQLQGRLRKYDITHLNTERAAEAVRNSGRLSITTSSRTFDLELVQNDLRAPNYRAEEVVDGGLTRDLPVSPIRTYKGKVTGMPGTDARFTIDDSTLEGMIVTPDDWYFVERARNYSATADDEEYLVYKASDVITDGNLACGTTLNEKIDHSLKQFSGVRPEIVSPQRVVELATEADFEYVDALGGSNAANNQILSIMNQVQGIYQTQVGLTFTVVYQHTWATSQDPYDTNGPASPMLQEFTDYWNGNLTSIHRDVTHLWTGRSMDAAGIAWLGVVCGAPTFSYGMSIRTSQSIFRVAIPAHEMGHNLGASHSDGTAACDNTIMQSVATSSTSLNFCQLSIDQITNYVNSYNSCLAISSGGSQIQFSSANYSVAESGDSGTLTVTRSGNTGGAATVEFSTADGAAGQRADYTINVGTLSFAPGETSKTINVLVSDDLYQEGSETISVTLSNPVGATLGSPGTATLTILDNDSGTASTNPLDGAQFFVRQHYYDFLNRAPDLGGLTYWSDQISGCGSDQACIRGRRISVSNAFFYELEFQQTGAYVYRLYRAAFGNDQPFPNPDTSNVTEARKIPSYAVFVRDRARVVGGATLAQSQLDLANAFVQRSEFLSRYPASMSASQFVDALLARISTDSGVNLGSQRAGLISLVTQNGRGTALYRVADDNVQNNPINNRVFIDAEYTRSFVYTQYAGYLRRDSDVGGFLFWLGQVNQFPVRDATIQSSMVCAFITSAEYQQRFSPAVTHSNSECGQ
jgi:Metallo-peptidase family M12/Calx-beta domain/Reprolysin family propeptide